MSTLCHLHHPVPFHPTCNQTQTICLSATASYQPCQQLGPLPTTLLSNTTKLVPTSHPNPLALQYLDPSISSIPSTGQPSCNPQQPDCSFHLATPLQTRSSPNFLPALQPETKQKQTNPTAPSSNSLGPPKPTTSCPPSPHPQIPEAHQPQVTCRPPPASIYPLPNQQLLTTIILDLIFSM